MEVYTTRTYNNLISYLGIDIGVHIFTKDTSDWVLIFFWRKDQIIVYLGFSFCRVSHYCR